MELYRLKKTSVLNTSTVSITSTDLHSWASSCSVFGQAFCTRGSWSSCPATVRSAFCHVTTAVGREAYTWSHKCMHICVIIRDQGQCCERFGLTLACRSHKEPPRAKKCGPRFKHDVAFKHVRRLECIPIAMTRHKLSHVAMAFSSPQ